MNIYMCAQQYVDLVLALNFYLFDELMQIFGAPVFHIFHIKRCRYDRNLHTTTSRDHCWAYAEAYGKRLNLVNLVGIWQ